MKKKTKTVKGWCVVDRTIDTYWPDNNIGLYAIFPSAGIAKQYRREANGGIDGVENQQVVKCTITYDLPANSSKKEQGE